MTIWDFLNGNMDAIAFIVFILVVGVVFVIEGKNEK